jgi:hypothetical protein
MSIALEVEIAHFQARRAVRLQQDAAHAHAYAEIHRDADRVASAIAYQRWAALDHVRMRLRLGTWSSWA